MKVLKSFPVLLSPSIDASALQLSGLNRDPIPMPMQLDNLTNFPQHQSDFSFAEAEAAALPAVDQAPLSRASSVGNSPSTTYQSCRSSSSPQPEASGSAIPYAGHELLVLGLPDAATRTRVETQIKLSLVLIQNSQPDSGRLTNSEGQLLADASDRASRVGDWSYIKLPEFAAVKKKNKKLAKTGIPAEETLFMDAHVLQSSGEKKEVFICDNCRQRETKRSQRKRTSKVKAEAQGNEVDEAEQVNQDPRRILLFNCGEYVDFNTGEVTLPTRIACYCRHHAEKTGFR